MDVEELEDDADWLPIELVDIDDPELEAVAGGAVAGRIPGSDRNGM